MISPANTYVGLTSDEPGSEPGEPDKYYPTGTRTYARIAPLDVKQGAAIVALMKQEGCTKVAMTNDKEVYGAGLARVIEMAAKAQGLTLTANDAIDKNASNYRALAAAGQGRRRRLLRVLRHHRQQRGPAVQGLRGRARRRRQALRSGRRLRRLFANEKEGGIPASLAPQVKCTVPRSLPTRTRPPARSSSRPTRRSSATPPTRTPSTATRRMALALDAIERSKTGEREDILKAIFATKDRESVLGTYSIDEKGDTTLGDYGAYTIDDGALKFDQTVKPVS